MQVRSKAHPARHSLHHRSYGFTIKLFLPSGDRVLHMDTFQNKPRRENVELFVLISFLWIYEKVPCIRVLRTIYINVRALAAKVMICLCLLPELVRENEFIHVCTHMHSHTYHSCSQQAKGCIHDSVTPYPGTLYALYIHLLQASSKYSPSALRGGAQRSDISTEEQDSIAKPSLSLRGRRERHVDLWHPYFNSHSITCLEQPDTVTFCP